jgi:hypothetical protein
MLRVSGFRNPKRKRGTELRRRLDDAERSLANASGYEKPSQTSSGSFQSNRKALHQDLRFALAFFQTSLQIDFFSSLLVVLQY